MDKSQQPHDTAVHDDQAPRYSPETPTLAPQPMKQYHPATADSQRNVQAGSQHKVIGAEPAHQPPTVNFPTAGVSSPYGALPGAALVVGYLKMTPHSGTNSRVTGHAHHVPAFATAQHQAAQQASQTFQFQPPIATKDQDESLQARLGRFKIPASPSVATLTVASPEPEFPYIEVILAAQTEPQYSGAIQNLPLYDYIFSDSNGGKSLSFTAVELITFLPHLCRSNWIATRLLNGKMSSTAHWEIHKQHRHTIGHEIGHQVIGNGYRDAMRGPDWRHREHNNWLRKSYKIPKDWVCTLEMGGFQPDRVIFGEGSAPDPVPMTILLHGVKKVPTGYDAADLTKAIEFAAQYTPNETEEYMFPTDLAYILDRVNRVTACSEHQDDAIARRYDKQYQESKPKLPVNKPQKPVEKKTQTAGPIAPETPKGPKRVAGGTSSPHPQVFVTPPSFKRQKLDAPPEPQAIPQVNLIPGHSLCEQSLALGQASGGPSPTPSQSLSVQRPAPGQSSSEQSHAETIQAFPLFEQLNASQQPPMQPDPTPDGLMRLTEVRGDEASIVNRLIRFAQRPDQQHIDWQWKQDHVNEATRMLKYATQAQAVRDNEAKIGAEIDRRLAAQAAQQHRNAGAEDPEAELTGPPRYGYDPVFVDSSGLFTDPALTSMSMTADEYKDLFGVPTPPDVPRGLSMPVMPGWEQLEAIHPSLDNRIAAHYDPRDFSTYNQVVLELEEELNGHDPMDLLRDCAEADDVMKLTTLAETARIARHPKFVEEDWHVQDMFILRDRAWSDATLAGLCDE